MIKEKKPTHGSARVLPRNHKSLLPLLIRGKKLWFLNSSRCVTLALQQGHEVEDLQFFFSELKKDIETHAYESASEEDQEMKEPEEQKPQKERPEQSLVTETLETIKEHQQ